MEIDPKVKKGLEWAQMIDELIQEAATYRAKVMTGELRRENQLLRNLVEEYKTLLKKK